MEPIDRDGSLDRALKALPAPRAPQTLLPRIMSAVAAAEAHEQRQHMRPWMLWPRGWRIASFTAMAAVTVAVIWLLPNIEVVLRTSAGWVSQRQPALGGGMDGAASIFSVGRTLWQTLVEPVLWYVVVWMIVMTTACAALGAALDLALGGASE